MVMATIQSGRASHIEITLGDTTITVNRLRGTEGLSQLFRFEVEFQSSTPLQIPALINQPATLRISQQAYNSAPIRERQVHGIISRFSYLGEITAPGQNSGHVSQYRVEIVPWLWLLTQKVNCRIFQDTSLPEIVETILSEYTGTVDQQGVTATYPDFELRVQYRESDFAFVSRLLEECGIFYYFRHTATACELVLSDGQNSWFACAETDVRFGNSDTGSVGDHVQSWEHDYAYRPSVYKHDDFNFTDPSSDLSAEVKTRLSLPGTASSTVYDYPGGYQQKTDGTSYATIRMEEIEASHEMIRGGGTSPCLVPGARFQLKNHPAAGETHTDFVVAFAEHETTVGGEGVRTESVMYYQNRFHCIPTSRTFRPPRLTPRPAVQGIQTAVVTGPDGDLIYTDEYGRVKIQFHWDQVAAGDDTTSCWIRVSQAWAGNGYGSMLLPHVGQEVIVSFLEGNPDRPVITGRLYNADNMPPEDLPDNKHRAIVAKDEVGNIIALDSDEKRVDVQNAEDKFELTVGESVTAAAGMDVGITLGCGVSLNLGAAASAGLAASFDVGVGISSSVFAGGSYDASFGGSFSYAKGNFVNAGDSVGQIAFKAGAEFVSHDSVMLAGGSGTNNSVVLASSDALTISYGMTSPTFKGNPSLALGLGVFGAAVVGTLGIAAAGTAAFLGGKAAEVDEFNDYAKGAVGSGVSSVALSAVAAGLLTAYAKIWSQMKQPVHGGALPEKAQVILEDKGICAVGAEEVSLMAGLAGKQGLVKLIADEVSLSTMKTTVAGDMDVKGVLQSANLRDIGTPAAAAAAKAAAAANRAARAAIIAAKAAQHAAKKAAETAAAMV